MREHARDILAGREGVTIVFAVLLVVVVLVLGGIMVSSGYAGYRRSVSDNADERDYGNVSSAVQLVHGELKGEKDAQDAAVERAAEDERDAVSASGWGTDLLSAAHGLASGSTLSRELTVSPGSEAASAGASFPAITVSVRKVSGGSYDVACSETGNATGVALHFEVGYTEETLRDADGGDTTVRRITSLASGIAKVGQ